jgi:Helix-turn-helix domain
MESISCGTQKSQTVSVPEAGRILGIGRNAAYDAAKRGELPVLKFGKRLVVPVLALERLLAAGTAKAA